MNEPARRPSRFAKLPPVLEMRTEGQGTSDKLATGVFVAVLLVLFVSGFLLLRQASFEFPSKPQIQTDWWNREFKRVQELFEQTRQYLPGQKKIPPLKKGHQLYKQKKYQEAIGQYSQAIEDDVSNFKAYFWRGRAYVKTDQLQPAIKDFERTIQLNPKYEPAFDNLGWLYGRQGDYDTSLGFLNRAIELAPDNGWAYFYRGFVYRKKGEMDKALADYREACRLKYRKACQIYQEMKRERIS